MREYAICKTRQWYGKADTKTRLADPESPDGYEWRGTREQARQLIEELDAEMYHTSHNESGRPTYTIVRA